MILGIGHKICDHVMYKARIEIDMVNSYNWHKVESLKAERYTLQSSNPKHPSKYGVNYHHNFAQTFMLTESHSFFVTRWYCIYYLLYIFASQIVITQCSSFQISHLILLQSSSLLFEAIFSLIILLHVETSHVTHIFK